MRLELLGNGDRFWSKVNIVEETACWNWIAGKSGHGGYGSFFIRHDGVTKSLRAHRVAWCLANKQDLDNHLVIRHTCDNKGCCNPKHLIIGTSHDNTMDKYDRNIPNGACQRKLTEDDVLLIYKLHRQYRAYNRIVQLTGFTRSNIQSIVRGESWKHLYHKCIGGMIK